MLVLEVDGVFEFFQYDEDWLQVLYFSEHLYVQLDDSGVFLRELLNLILDFLDLVLNFPVVGLFSKIGLLPEFELLL